MVFLFLALLMVFSMTRTMTESFTVTDMFDREATLEDPFTRIVVLEPADCEILCTPCCEEALVGAALSLCGAAMQGLLRNPLADGSTLDVSSGTALGKQTKFNLMKFQKKLTLLFVNMQMLKWTRFWNVMIETLAKRLKMN